MTTPLFFFVPGHPEPAGSKRGFAIKKGGSYTGRVAIVDDNKNSKGWKTDVSRHVSEARRAVPLLEGPLHLTLTFYMPRPKVHLRTGKNSGMLRATAPVRPTTKPDVLKLARAVEDALTNVLWIDDAQIVSEYLHKHYADDRSCGVSIEVRQILTW